MRRGPLAPFGADWYFNIVHLTYLAWSRRLGASSLHFAAAGHTAAIARGSGN
jgi:hypothetical protein